MLVRTGKAALAITHDLAATQLLPNDQIAGVGLAEPQRLAGNTKDALDAYRAAVRSVRTASLRTKARAGTSTSSSRLL